MEPTPLAPGKLDKITLSELLGALSHALDLTEGQPAGHCVRCSRIGVEIGREIGLSEDEIAELYYALLLKDLGCSSNAARICELYLTDDLSFKQDFKFIDGSLPQALRPIYSRIALMVQVIDVFHVSNGPEAALREAQNRSGTWFDPHLVAAFERIAARPAFWDMLRTDDGHEAALPQPPEQASLPIDEDYLDDIAAAFAQVVDSKSPYTSGHSERVTLFSDMIAEQLEFSAEQRRWLKRAALLHDIGKLGVSNAILDKPGKLDDAEWEIMRMHSAHSEAILSRIGAFRELAPIAGAHHERLDGKGYPRGLSGDQICLETRIIITADIFDALTAERPYRAAMPVTKALTIMSEMVGTQIDANCFAALGRALGRIDETLAA